MRRGGGGGGGRLVRVALWSAGALVVLLGLAQLLLPKVAASRISSRVSRYGTVRSVRVTAWPAVKLLWGDADSVDVRAANLKASPAQAAKLLGEARGLGDLQLSATSARVGALPLSDVALRKQGRSLTAHALVAAANVKAVLPEGFDVQLLGSEKGRIELRASGGLFGIGASVGAVAEASEGRLIVHPRGLLIEALRLTLFSDRHIYVEGVGARATSDSEGRPSYLLSLTARLH